jgi:hypothetical protein
MAVFWLRVPRPALTKTNLTHHYLSQSERFQRKWPSLYAAVEDGQIDTEAGRQLLIDQLPQKGICFFAQGLSIL